LKSHYFLHLFQGHVTYIETLPFSTHHSLSPSTKTVNTWRLSSLRHTSSLHGAGLTVARCTQQ